MAPAAVAAAGNTDEDALHVVNVERYSYVFDWAALVRLSSEDPVGGGAQSLRAFAIPTGFATHAGLPGHYIVNSASSLDASTIQLPAVVEMVDEGVAPLLATTFKLASNDKIYILAVELPLLKSCDKEGKESWVDDTTQKLLKFELVKRFLPVKNRDGIPLAKHADIWLSKHSNTFGDIAIKSISASRSWCASGRFRANLGLVISSAENRIRMAAKKASVQSKKTSRLPAKNPEKAAAEEEHVKQKLALLESVHNALKEAAPYYSAPLQSRLLHAALEPAEEGKELNIDGLVQIIKRDSQHADSLLNLVKLAEVAKLLSDGKAGAPPFGTPLRVTTQRYADKVQAAEAVEAAAAAEAAVEAADEAAQISRSNSLQDIVEIEKEVDAAEEEADVDQGASLRPKRSRAPPEILSPDGRKTAKKPKKAEESQKVQKSGSTNSAEAEDSSDEERRKQGKRVYRKTGLFSKNPHVAAIARAKLKTDKPTAAVAGTPPPRLANSNLLNCSTAYTQLMVAHRDCWRRAREWHGSEAEGAQRGAQEKHRGEGARGAQVAGRARTIANSNFCVRERQSGRGGKVRGGTEVRVPRQAPGGVRRRLQARHGAAQATQAADEGRVSKTRARFAARNLGARAKLVQVKACKWQAGP